MRIYWTLKLGPPPPKSTFFRTIFFALNDEKWTETRRKHVLRKTRFFRGKRTEYAHPTSAISHFCCLPDYTTSKILRVSHTALDFTSAIIVVTKTSQHVGQPLCLQAFMIHELGCVLALSKFKIKIYSIYASN